MKPDPASPEAKFFISVIHGGGDIFRSLLEKIRLDIGGTDYVSPSFPFAHTDYYEGEMGRGLLRQFASLRGLRPPPALIDLKRICLSIEEGLSLDGRRRVNLDPGYLDAQKVVLASAKYGSWKLYLGGGTYGDLTLHYRQGRFHPFDWTFPDFRAGCYDKALMHIRSLYKSSRGTARPPAGSRV